MTNAERLRYIAGNIEQDQREHSARYLREIADRIEAGPTVPDWFECERISNLDDVDDCIRGLVDDPTSDAATMVVRAVIKAYLEKK